MEPISNNYELRVLVGGKPISHYADPKSKNWFIEGRRGSEFEIEFRNKTGGRLLVVPSVDGVSTLEGTPATPDSKGYVVGPHATLRIPGWTLDNGSVAKFVFDDKKSSYARHANATRGTSQAGVIGLLVYAQKVVPVTTSHTVYVKPVYPYPYYYGYPYPYPLNLTGSAPTWTSNAATMQPVFSTATTANNVAQGLNNVSLTADAVGAIATASAVATSNSISVTEATKSARRVDLTASEQPFSLGTGWGERTEFKTNNVEFERGDMTAQLALYYDSRRNLEKRGIEVVKRDREYLSDLPSPFQGVGCKPPPGWNG